ncbi:N-formylglutamate amidohydrolase [Micrococcus terreus]|uniref:N-formylglutamate amidohydrolase n=1 Tax=Micrococcus terreus TaxID=574650 RepID=UPI003017A457
MDMNTVDQSVQHGRGSQDPSAAFRAVGPWAGPGAQGTDQVIFTAVHAGHDLRDEVRELMVLDEDTRLREEDPFTDRLGTGVGSGLVMNRSRFEVDVNRPRATSVYQTPDECWGLDVWQYGRLPDEVAERSRAIHDAWFTELGRRLDVLAARGPFVVFDIHSYNHYRDGQDQPAAPQEGNPDINVGTGSLDREPWIPVVDAFMEAMGTPEVKATGRPLDVRENVRFWGQNQARWIHRRYPDTACVLALEFKKTWMDEWTGVPDQDHMDELAQILASTVPAVTQALKQVKVPTP